MKDLFVPYEIARQLKEKGFNDSCFMWWYSPTQISDDLIFRQYKSDKDFCEAPTHQQVINWLDTKGIVIEIQVDQTAEPKYCFQVLKYEHFGNYEKHEPSEWFLYRNRTEATNVAIHEALKLI
jgi:hypothetical protein